MIGKLRRITQILPSSSVPVGQIPPSQGEITDGNGMPTYNVNTGPVTVTAGSTHLDLFSMLKVFEPMEFYEVRQKSYPKAPSTVRFLFSSTIIVLMVALFIYVAITSSSSYRVETDLYRTIPDEVVKQWDSCIPITTLGSSYTPFTMTFADDCYKRLQVNAYKVFFASTAECINTLAPKMDEFCHSFDRNGWMIQKMVGMTLFTKNVSVGFDSYSCNGNFIVPEHLMFPLPIAIPNCTENFLHLNFDYDEPTALQWENECMGILPNLCDSIFASSNPYKCSRKVRTGLVYALSDAYAFTTLVFSIGVVVTASCFSIFYRTQLKSLDFEDKELSA